MSDSLYAQALSPDQRRLFADTAPGTLDDEIRLARVRLYHHTLRAACLDEDEDSVKNGHAEMMLKLMAMICRLEIARAALLRGQDSPEDFSMEAGITIAPDEPLPDAPIL